MTIKHRQNLSNCDHCGLEVISPIHYGDKIFCCHGCENVFKILKDHDLSQYYSIKDQGVRFSRINSPITNSHPLQDYFYLDQEAFFEDYAGVLDQGTKKFQFYIEGIHCMACIWLLEQLSSLLPLIKNSKLNFSESILEIEYDESLPLSQIAYTLNQIGYTPHPFKSNSEQLALEKKFTRKELTRLSVTAVCAGNIMLFAVALYAGASKEWERLFSWLSFALSIPVLTYGSAPFYKNFIRDIKTKRLSIDTPIVLALVLGFSVSLWNLLHQSSFHYFDTLSILVFLILSSRYFLNQMQKKGLRLNHLGDYFLKQTVLRYSASKNEFESSHLNQLKVGDILKLNQNEIVPVDGKILKGSAYINTSLIDGEFKPKSISPGQNISSGYQIINGSLDVETLRVAYDSELGKILESVKKNWQLKNKTVQITDRFARYLIAAVLIFSIIFFIYLLPSGLEVAINRTLALIIITCPCALGLATPLAMARSIKIALKQGIVIKSSEAIENTSKIENIFFDKTGTLTKGHYQVSSWSNESSTLYPFILTLEERSQHPIAKALINYIQQKGHFESLVAEDYKEVLGKGVQARILNDTWRIESLHLNKAQPSSSYQSRVGLYRNDQLISVIIFQDEIRPQTKSLIGELKKLNLTSYLITGDAVTSARYLAQKIDINSEHVFAETSPQRKKKLLEGMPNSMMIGDGANDVQALRQANVGVAIKGGISMSLKVSDIYLSGGNINKLIDMIKLSRDTMFVIKRNIVFSIVYNIIGITAASLGWVTPLWAAIFMPLSSLTVFLSTLAGTQTIRELSQGTNL